MRVIERTDWLAIIVLGAMITGCGVPGEPDVDSATSQNDQFPANETKAISSGLWGEIYLHAKSGEIERAEALYSRALQEEEGEDDEYGDHSSEGGSLSDLFDFSDKTKSLEPLGQMCIVQAASYGDIDSVRMLLDQKVNVDSTFLYNMTPLGFATTDSNVELASLLLDHGADVNHKGIMDMTPLLHAVTEGRSPQLVQLLLTHGANPRVQVNFGNMGSSSVIEAARESENQEIISLIEEALSQP